MPSYNVGQYDFSGESRCNQGATFIMPLTFFEDEDRTEPTVLTGLEFRMQARLTKSSPDIVLELISDGLEYESDDSVHGTITLGDDGDGNTDNRLILRIEASETERLTGGTYRYDIESVSSDAEPVVVRRMEGRFTVNPEVTRPA